MILQRLMAARGGWQAAAAKAQRQPRQGRAVMCRAQLGLAPAGLRWFPLGGWKRASCSSWCRRAIWPAVRSLGEVLPSTPPCISSASLPVPPEQLRQLAVRLCCVWPAMRLWVAELGLSQNIQLTGMSSVAAAGIKTCQARVWHDDGRAMLAHDSSRGARQWPGWQRAP